MALVLALVTAAPHASAAQPGVGRAEPAATPTPVPGQPYERFSTRDRFGREVSFYLSTAPSDRGPLPLVAYVEGSGCRSPFEERDGRVLPAGGHIVVADVFRGRARVLVVERPGVAYLAQPADGCTASAAFNREHTLERWAEANEAAIRAARQLPRVRPDGVLVVGHSEGGLVACRVARDLPEVVTHVATLAGGGGSQLYDLLALARRGVFFADVSPDPERRVRFVLDRWRDIRAEPQRADRFFFGFAYRRWVSFLASSPAEELRATRARVYIAQGTADLAVDPTSADLLYAQLVAGGRAVSYDRVEGGSHSFRLKDQPAVDGWAALFQRIAAWFLPA